MTADRRFKVRTVQAVNPGDLLARLHDSRPLAWVRRSDGLIGWGESAAITVPAGPCQFGAAGRALRGLFEAADTEDHVGLPGSWRSGASPSTRPAPARSWWCRAR